MSAAAYDEQSSLPSPPHHAAAGGGRGYALTTLTNSSGGSEHSPGRRAGATLVAISPTEALLFGGVTQADGSGGVDGVESACATTLPA